MYKEMALTLVQARDRARKDLSMLLDGEDPSAKRDASRKAMLFKDFAEDYITREVMPHHKGYKQEISRIRLHLIKHFGNYPVVDITHDQVTSVHLEIGGKYPAGANRVVKILSAMLTKAEKWGVVPAGTPNPAKGISFFRELPRDRYVTPEELPALIESLEQEDIYPRSAFWLYLLTGFRKTELLSAKWSQVDFENRQFILPDSKGGRPHYLPLTVEAMAILEGIPRLQGNPHIFPGLKEGAHLADLKKPWIRIRKRAGLEDVHIHDLRHTIASWLVQAGNSLYLVGKILNHKDLRTTERYARFAQDNLRDALEGTSQRMTGIAGKSGSAEVVPLGKKQTA
ncbi:site-specific integrase [Thiothrix litoralis]|uniref:Site-specific integrase n=1 Tax=Thiothrix litoralis TaxID=2891210 RepID=A0ABX7WNK8_9GAMM|nr:site-specific integrase [Thiothrix litoralis]QTR45384.1 site-specific integrase [Thiothrix litoralis]